MSGGLDSAVLAVLEAQEHEVQPIYVTCGLPWERTEEAFLSRFVATCLAPHVLLPIVRLELPMRDVYPDTHWAIRREPPGYGTTDKDLYLAGRNIALLAKTGIYCAGSGIHRIVMGQLHGNPFPDSTPDFLSSMARSLSLGLNHRVDIALPFISKTKADVIRLGASLKIPFELTMSCLNPGESAHCGACGKCRERREAFIASGVADGTTYAALPTNLR
jgi:7-cyano-7-deazaguanine synthase